MEELIERVSAIFDSPVLGYSRHKTYRQMLLICLVYLLCFYNSFPAFAEETSDTNFEPYVKEVNKERINVKAYEKWNANAELSSMESVDRAAAIMLEVDELFGKLDASIKELSEIQPESDEDRKMLLKAFAELDGVLSYVYAKLKYGKDQLSAALSVTSEDEAKCNSLKIRFMSDMQLANELKRVIASKLANASNEGKK